MQPVKKEAIVPIFYTEQVEDVVQSRAAGRPVFVEQERIEYRMPARRDFNFHDLAHGFHQFSEDGEVITHAMRFPEAYRKFKETGGQSVSGIPVSNIPGITPVQLSTLKALSIYTVEAMAQLEGQALKNVGPGGHALKAAAQKYLDVSSGGANISEVMAEIAALKKQNEALAAAVAANQPRPVSDFKDAPADDDATPADDKYAAMSADDLRAQITMITGKGVRGQPSRETLVGILRDIEAEASAE